MLKEDVIEPSELTTGKSEFKLWHCLPFIIKPWSFIIRTMYIVIILHGDVVKITEYFSFGITSLKSKAERNAFPNSLYLREGARSGQQLSQNANQLNSSRNKMIKK